MRKYISVEVVRSQQVYVISNLVAEKVNNRQTRPRGKWGEINRHSGNRDSTSTLFGLYSRILLNWKTESTLPPLKKRVRGRQKARDVSPSTDAAPRA